MSLEKFLKECEARVCPCDFGKRCDDFYKLFRIVKEMKQAIAQYNPESNFSNNYADDCLKKCNEIADE